MADREKVIRDLESFVDDEWLWKKADFVALTCRNALALLKKQESVKPKTDDAWPYPIKVCGACGTCLFKVGDYKPKYCAECGRAVKWG